MGKAARLERFEPARRSRDVLPSRTTTGRLSRGVSVALLFSLPIWAMVLYAILR